MITELLEHKILPLIYEKDERIGYDTHVCFHQVFPGRCIFTATALENIKITVKIRVSTQYRLSAHIQYALGKNLKVE